MRRQSTAQIIGRAGERWFSTLLPKEWSFQRPIDDFGSDGIVALGDKKSMSALEFGVQIKSRRNIDWKSGKCRISITREMAQYFSQKIYPVLFILYDEKNNIGYYSWFTDIFDIKNIKSAKNNLSIYIDISNSLSKNEFKNIENRVKKHYFDFGSSIEYAKMQLEILELSSYLLKFSKSVNFCNMLNHKKGRNIENNDRYIEMTKDLMIGVSSDELMKELDEFVESNKISSILKIMAKKFREEFLNKISQVIADFEKNYPIEESKLYYINPNIVEEKLDECRWEAGNFALEITKFAYLAGRDAMKNVEVVRL